MVPPPTGSPNDPSSVVAPRVSFQRSSLPPPSDASPRISVDACDALTLQPVSGAVGHESPLSCGRVVELPAVLTVLVVVVDGGAELLLVLDVVGTVKLLLLVDDVLLVEDVLELDVVADGAVVLVDDDVLGVVGGTVDVLDVVLVVDEDEVDVEDGTVLVDVELVELLDVVVLVDEVLVVVVDPVSAPQPMSVRTWRASEGSCREPV